MLNLMLHLACCSKLSRLCTDEADAVSILQRFAACVPSSWEVLLDFGVKIGAMKIYSDSQDYVKQDYVIARLCEAVPNCNALCLCMLKGMCRA